MIQLGFFNLQGRLRKIDKNGDPLAKINETVESAARSRLVQTDAVERATNSAGFGSCDQIEPHPGTSSELDALLPSSGVKKAASVPEVFFHSSCAARSFLRW